MSRSRRLLTTLATFVAVCVLAFFVVELTPGDTASARLGTGGDDVAREALRHALGIDGPLFVRLLRWLSHLARFDLGRSLSDGRPVLEKIAERLPTSLLLAVVALSLAWAIALPLAIERARRSRADSASTVELVLVALSYSVPLPALALAMVACGAGYGATVGGVLAAAACLLPLLVPRIYAHCTGALAEALAADDARTLRAVGASPSRVVRVALRSTALRLVTLVSLQLPALLSGVVLVEGIFGLPGLGTLAFDALAARDHSVQLGLVIVGAAITLGCALIVDLIAPRLDPRLAATGSRR